MPKPRKKLLIIDGNALVHRSFHALPTTMHTKGGEVTNAVYGFATVLIKALKEFKPEYVVVTFDKKAKTFRHEAYAEYKATRQKAPDELYAQFPRIQELARAFNIPVFEKEGFEADDLIGTITRHDAPDIENIIVTGDMDTMQLVNERTKVYRVNAGVADTVLYDTDAVKQKFQGLGPEQMVDYKALRGDASDNIPGVPGIGEKTAITLLTEFKTLENLYGKLEANELGDAVKPRIQNLLREHKDQAFLSKKLATIICDVPLDFELDKATARDFDINRVANLFEALEFKTLIPRLSELASKLQAPNRSATDEQAKFTAVQNNCSYTLIDTETALRTLAQKLSAQKAFAYDTETANFNPRRAQLLGISISWKKNEAYYIHIQNAPQSGSGTKRDMHNQGELFAKQADNTHTSGVPLETAIEQLKPIFENESIAKVCHNAKFDIHALRAQGMAVRGVAFDTMLAAYLLDPGGRNLGLDACSLNYLGYHKISKDDLLGTGRNKIAFADVDPERLALYSCEDADCTWQLYEVLRDKIKEAKLEKLFYEMELPLVSVLTDMEEAGITLDTHYLAKLEKELAQRLQKLESQIHEQAGGPFNVNSTKQLQEVLFDRLELPTHAVKRTKTGYSTAADELEKLRGEHKIIDLIGEYREIAKLQNTYVSALPELVDETDGRLHTTYQQHITATGRLSSTDPNLQNIPIRTDEGRKIRHAFVAQKGFVLLGADYSQIELRLAAALSGDEKMIAAFQNDQDIHATTAAEINDVPLKDVTKEMRREAKAINFGILYGQGPFGLSQTADITQARAKEFIDRYFKTYQGIKRWIDDNLDLAHEHEETTTLFGRVRSISEINSSNAQLRKGAERIATNTPIQGTAADIIKIAMINVAERLQPYGQQAQLLLQVHDELVLEVAQSLQSEIAALLKDEMEHVIERQTVATIPAAIKQNLAAVTIRADVETGENWEEMSETTVAE